MGKPARKRKVVPEAALGPSSLTPDPSPGVPGEGRPSAVVLAHPSHWGAFGERVAMSLKTTLLLLVLIGTGGLVLWFGGALGPWLHLTPEPLPAAPGDTLSILQNDLTDAKITRLDMHV